MANGIKFGSLCRSGLRGVLAAVALAAPAALPACAAEHITLRNGFSLDCVRREAAGDRVRLYLLTPASSPSDQAASYIEVSSDAILSAEPIALPDESPSHALAAVAASAARPLPAPPAPALTPAEMHELLARAGASHNIDADLLAALVHAESNGNARAVSRAGAQGLMQLMPGTAAELNVHDAFAAEDNIGGGSTYLDQMLTRYHDNLALALAAYNAGPAAVDRYHGIPPYAETRAYVARVIREFNRRKTAATSSQIAVAR